MRAFKFPKQQHACPASFAFVKVLAHSRAQMLCLGQLTHQFQNLYPHCETKPKAHRPCDVGHEVTAPSAQARKAGCNGEMPCCWAVA